jgi:rare lipoprotein A
MTISRFFLNTFTLAILSVLAYPGFAEEMKGQASYYADRLQGSMTASGEPYDSKAMTAAHRTLAFGTKVKVTYLKTSKTVEVTINDRGPHVKGRLPRNSEKNS